MVLILRKNLTDGLRLQFKITIHKKTSGPTSLMMYGIPVQVQWMSGVVDSHAEVPKLESIQFQLKTQELKQIMTKSSQNSKNTVLSGTRKMYHSMFNKILLHK